VWHLAADCCGGNGAARAPQDAQDREGARPGGDAASRVNPLPLTLYITLTLKHAEEGPRPCLLRPHPTAPGSRSRFHVARWDATAADPPLARATRTRAISRSDREQAREPELNMPLPLPPCASRSLVQGWAETNLLPCGTSRHRFTLHTQLRAFAQPPHFRAA
jgi:hypothetical protein